MAGSVRTLPWDWYPGAIPENVDLDETVYLETTYSFYRYRSELPVGVRIGRGTCIYAGTMFDVGPHGRVSIGQCALLNSAMFICDSAIEIGDYALISWNVLFMDSSRLATDPQERRSELRQLPLRHPRLIHPQVPAQPIRIEPNVWIGFNTCVLPGVTIGEGAIVGARSLVVEDVAPYSVVAGNPARFIRSLKE
jgi:acetyltransferase-like isoleucine patch superfamily enzyme